MRHGEHKIRLPRLYERHPITFYSLILASTAIIVPALLFFISTWVAGPHAYGYNRAITVCVPISIGVLCSIFSAAWVLPMRGIPGVNPTPLDNPELLIDEWQPVLEERVKVSEGNPDVARFLYKTTQSLIDRVPTIFELEAGAQRQLLQDYIEHGLNRDALESFLRAEEAREERQHGTATHSCNRRPSMGSTTF